MNHIMAQVIRIFRTSYFIERYSEYIFFFFGNFKCSVIKIMSVPMFSYQ